MFFGKKKKNKKAKAWIKPVKRPRAPKAPKAPRTPGTPGSFGRSLSLRAAGPGLKNKPEFVKSLRRSLLDRFWKAGADRLLITAIRKFLLLLLVVGMLEGPAGMALGSLYTETWADQVLPGVINARAAETEDQGGQAAEGEQLQVTTSLDGLSVSTQAVIYDNADLLTEGEEQALLTHMLPVTSYGDAVFISRSQVDGSTEDYIQTTYRQLYGSSSAVIFLIDMDNRNIWIFSDGQIHDTITNSYAETITDNVYTLAGDGDYYGCSAEAFDQMSRLLAGQSIARPAKYLCNALLAVILGVILNYIIVRIVAARNEAGSEEILDAIHFSAQVSEPSSSLARKVRVKRKSSGGGGGGRSGGGGGGGSGGGGGHGF